MKLTGREVFQQLIKEGKLYILPDCPGEYFGDTADGIQVNMGSTKNMQGLYDYLEEHSTVDTW